MKRAIAVLAALVAFAAAAQAPLAPEPSAAPQPQADREIQIAEGAFTKDAKVPAWVQPRALGDSKTVGPAVVALSDTQVMVGDETATYLRRAIKLNNAAALTP